MKVRHSMGLSFAAVLLLTITLAAANTDVADAAMRKDRAAVQALLQKGANVNARTIRWRNEPCIGRSITETLR